MHQNGSHNVCQSNPIFELYNSGFIVSLIIRYKNSRHSFKEDFVDNELPNSSLSAITTIALSSALS